MQDLQQIHVIRFNELYDVLCGLGQTKVLAHIVSTKYFYPKVAISMGQLMKLEVPHFQTHSEKPISRTAWWHSAGTMNVSTNFIRLSHLLNYLRVNTCESYHVASEITQYKYQNITNQSVGCDPSFWARCIDA